MAAAPLIMGGASILGGILGKNGASKAAKAETQLGREALSLQGRMFDLQRADSEPWRRIGGQSLGDAFAMLQPGYDHTTSPGYQFRFGEAMRGAENSAAARGILQAGGTLRGLERVADGLASSDFGDKFNRLSTLGGMGSAANGQSAAAGSNYANAGANILGNIGQARASGYAGQNQALQGTLGNLFSLYNSGAFGKGF